MSSLAKHLEAHGLDPIGAGVWATFVGAVFEALVAARASLVTPNEWAQYCNATAGAFTKPKRSGPHRGKSLPTEEGITTELVDRMMVYARSVSTDHVLRKWYVTFECEGRVRSPVAKGKSASRTDIRAIADGQVGARAPEFVIEAKLIERTSDLRRKLLGKDGLGCFTRSVDPYTDADVGALLAYIVSDDMATWLVRLEAAYGQRPSLGRQIAHLLIGSTIPVVCASVRRSGNPTDIAMLGVALRFDTRP